MDALFFSHRPEDHASLARAIANLDPAAFTSLAQAMQSIAAGSAGHASASNQSQANADGSRTAGVSPAPLACCLCTAALRPAPLIFLTYRRRLAGAFGFSLVPPASRRRL
jgi:hypothetical protein